MNNVPVIHHYAQALLEVAEDSGIVDIIKTDLDIVQSCFNESSSGFSLLLSPSLDRNARKLIIEKAFAGNVSATTINFLKIVAYNNRQMLLSKIADAYTSLLSARNSEVIAIVESVCAFDESNKMILKEKLDKKYHQNFKLSFRENKSLLGGFTVLFDNTLVDNSISGKVKILRQAMTGI